MEIDAPHPIQGEYCEYDSLQAFCRDFLSAPTWDGKVFYVGSPCTYKDERGEFVFIRNSIPVKFIERADLTGKNLDRWPEASSTGIRSSDLPAWFWDLHPLVRDNFAAPFLRKDGDSVALVHVGISAEESRNAFEAMFVVSDDLKAMEESWSGTV